MDQIAITYSISPAYCSVLSKLEELSRRELRNQQEVAAILASRRCSRSGSPAEGNFIPSLTPFEPHDRTRSLNLVLSPSDFATILDGFFPANKDPNNRTMSQSIQPNNISTSNIISNDTRNLDYSQFEASSSSFTFDPSRTLGSTPVFPATSLLYGHLHETFFSEMPINLPSSTDDMSNWNTFQADYEALLDNQPYSNQPS